MQERAVWCPVHEPHNPPLTRPFPALRRAQVGYFKELKGKAYDVFASAAKATEDAVILETTSKAAAAAAGLTKVDSVAVVTNFASERRAPSRLHVAAARPPSLPTKALAARPPDPSPPSHAPADEERVVAPLELGADAEADDITELIKANKLPTVIEFTSESSSKIFGAGIDKQVRAGSAAPPACCAPWPPKCPAQPMPLARRSHCPLPLRRPQLLLVAKKEDITAGAASFDQFKAVAAANKGKAVFVTVDASGASKDPVMNFFGVKEDDVPAVRRRAVNPCARPAAYAPRAELSACWRAS
jgi:hypothetical protein